MNTMIRTFGKFNTAAIMVMIAGLFLFMLTPLFLKLFDLDTDIIGLLVFAAGLVMWVVGFIIRKNRRKNRIIRR